MTTHLLKTLLMMGAFADTGKPYFLGGTITESGGYRVHTFTSNGTLEIVNGGFVEVLVVGRGGNGGSGSVDYLTTYNGGGGGGGGVVYRPSILLHQSVAITVGGAATNTIFGNLITALGGGKGGNGSYGGGNGDNGGSGGGNGQSYGPNPVRNAGTGLQPGSLWGGYGSNGIRDASGGNGGSSGFICPFDGVYYGKGGKRGDATPDPGLNYGDGGNGGRGVGGAAGKQGVVKIRYEL